MKYKIKVNSFWIILLILFVFGGHVMAADTEMKEKSFAGLDANKEYVFLVVKDSSLTPVLNEDNLLYIDQKSTDVNGKVKFSYRTKNGETGTELICGNGKSVESLVSIGSEYYMSLASAIQSVPNNTETTINIHGPISETIVISKDQIINIDLNGNTISGEQSDQTAITNYGTLKIGNGVVDGSVDNEGRIDGFKDASQQFITASFQKQVFNKGSVGAGIFYNAIINEDTGSIDNTTDHVKIVYYLDETPYPLTYGTNLKTALNLPAGKNLYYILKDNQPVGSNDLVLADDLTLRQIKSKSTGSPLIVGDVDKNGALELNDAILAKKIAMKDSEMANISYDLSAGDLNQDNKITINEARKIKRAVLDDIPLTEETGTVLSIGKVQAHAGDQNVSVAISIKNNPGILGATLKLEYPDVLTLTGYSNGNAFSCLNLTPPGKKESPCNFVWDNVDIKESEIQDGEILILTFNVDNTAQTGTYPIQISYSDYGVTDRDLNPVTLTIKRGFIRVVN